MTRRPVWAATASLAVLLIPLVAAGCGGDDEEALTVYSGRTQELIEPLIEQYTEDTGVPVDVRYGDTADLALLIAEEGDRSPADVFLSQSPGAVEYLDAKGLLAQIDTETLALVDEEYRGPDDNWVGLSGRQRVLVYNSDLVSEDELPESVFDLTDEKYAGDVALAPSNGSFQDFVTAMRQVEGEDAARDWLTAMADNGSPTYANNNAIVEAVGRGEVPMGLVNHYYNFRFLEEDPSLPSVNHEFAAGDIGALVIPSSASILASSDQKEEAGQLIDFLLSDESQAYFAEETKEYPLVEGVAAPEGLTPLDELQPPAVEIAELGDLEATAKLIQESGLQ